MVRNSALGLFFLTIITLFFLKYFQPNFNLETEYACSVILSLAIIISLVVFCLCEMNKDTERYD